MPSACKRANSLKVSRLGMNHPSGNTASTSLPPDPPKFGDAEQHGCDGPGRGKRFGLDVHKVVTCPSGLDEMWCWTRVLWQTVGVETIALIIESRPDDKFSCGCLLCLRRSIQAPRQYARPQGTASQEIRYSLPRYPTILEIPRKV